MERTQVGLVLAALFAVGIISTAATPGRAFATETNFINIEAGTDFPYGISCDDADHVYVTLFNDGRLAKIDKATKDVLDVIDNPQTGTFQQGFYSVARDAGGNLWINERDGGKVWKYEPSSDEWTPIPIVEEIVNPKVDYPQTYELRPNLIRIDENPSPFGVTTYHVSLPAFGGVISANGHIYVGLGYSTSFHEEAFTLAGVSDLQFTGLAKIDPSTNEVTRISIPGAFSPTGLSIDANNSNILWITDQFNDKIYKYDLSTETVLETIELEAGLWPRGIDNSAGEVFVALNKEWDPIEEENSKILRISKADTSSQSIIDTDAPNNAFGAFTVFVVDNYLLWTDQSQHIGLVNLSTNTKTYETTEFATGNHFGCQVGDEFWFAGKGSAVVGTVNIAALAASTVTDVDEHEESSIGTTSTGDSTQLANEMQIWKPIRETLAPYDMRDVEEASESFNPYHKGNKIYFAWVHFRQIADSYGLNDLQKAWLFEQVKSELLEKFYWVRDR